VGDPACVEGVAEAVEGIAEVTGPLVTLSIEVEGASLVELQKRAHETFAGFFIRSSYGVDSFDVSVLTQARSVDGEVTMTTYVARVSASERSQ
jgi:hypothetical protein